jgi:chromosome segregation ATPase
MKGVRKMKSQIIMLTALIAVGLVFASIHLVAAEDNLSGNETTNLISANPDATASVSDAESDLDESEDISTVGMGMKQVGIWFTFNQEKKAQKELQLAKLQLIRAKIAARNNNTVAMEKALEAHDRLIERVQARVDRISKSNAGGNLTGLDRAIAVHEARIAKLNAILQNENLTDAQKAKLEARLTHVENVTAKLRSIEGKIDEKLQNLESRLEAVKNKTESLRDKANSARNRSGNESE